MISTNEASQTDLHFRKGGLQPRSRLLQQRLLRQCQLPPAYRGTCLELLGVNRKPCRLYPDIFEPRCLQFSCKFFHSQRPGDASSPCVYAAPDLFRHRPQEYHIRNGDPAARLQHPEDLPENSILVGGQIYHAIRDYRIHASLRKGDLLDEALQELHVVKPQWTLFDSAAGSSRRSYPARRPFRKDYLPPARNASRPAPLPGPAPLPPA